MPFDFYHTITSFERVIVTPKAYLVQQRDAFGNWVVIEELTSDMFLLLLENTHDC